jgi:hypothetical protein
MLFIKKKELLQCLPARFGTNNGRYHRGARNVESDQGIAGLGKAKPSALDGRTDGLGNGGVPKDLTKMGAVHKQSAAA